MSTETQVQHTTIEIVTLVSANTKEGLVELRINETRAQLDILKAREILHMLGEAIEAAQSDSMLVRFLVDHVGLEEEIAAGALGKFREMRFGTPIAPGTDTPN